MSPFRAILFAGAAGMLLASCGGSVGTPAPVDTSKMMISVDSTFTQSVPVGNPTSFTIDIKDVGTVDIPNLNILFDTPDKFMDKYTIGSAGSCKVDKNLPGLACGKLAHGADLSFTLTATPKVAGSFVFKFHVADDKQLLNQADGNLYVYSWTQTVTA